MTIHPPARPQQRQRFVDDGLGATTGPRLLLLLFDRLLRDIDDAGGALAARQLGPAHECLVHAQEIVEELLLALDPGLWDGANQLAALYAYAHGLLVQANVTKDPTPLADAAAVLRPLRDTWVEATAQQAAVAAEHSAAAAHGVVVAGAGVPRDAAGRVDVVG